MIRVKNLVNYILNNVDNEDIRYTQSVMNRKRCDLPRANWELYNDLEIFVLRRMLACLRMHPEERAIDICAENIAKRFGRSASSY